MLRGTRNADTRGGASIEGTAADASAPVVARPLRDMHRPPCDRAFARTIKVEAIGSQFLCHEMINACADLKRPTLFAP